MDQLIEKPRNVCALGAFQSVLAISGAVPVVHSGPGCVYKLGNATGMQNGGQFLGPLSPNMIPCTDISNSEVIFGGEEKLASLIETSQKVFDGDLYVVLSGCTPAIVGDDVGEVVRNFDQSVKPVVYAETTGFLGNNLWGHGKMIESIITQYLKPTNVQNSKQVNIWGVIPVYDPFWLGTLNDIEKLLAEVGLEANIIYGPERGIASIDKVPSAAFNLVLSPWWDLDIAVLLEEKFGTPYFHYPVLPIGPTETNNFLRELAKYAKLDESLVESVIKKHEVEYYVYLERAITEFVGIRRFPKHFITVANSSYSVAVTRFLTNDLGMIPDIQYITDGVPEKHEGAVRAGFEKLGKDLPTEVVFTEDGGRAHEEIRKRSFYAKPFILGSSWEKTLTAELDGYFLSISTPASDRVILDRSYFGYSGGLRLIEDFYSVVQADFQ